jgi:hypothetical protein
VFGAAWQHDGAAVGDKPVGRGTCFVVVGIIVELPFCTRPVCLPAVSGRRPAHQTMTCLHAVGVESQAPGHDVRRDVRDEPPVVGGIGLQPVQRHRGTVRCGAWRRRSRSSDERGRSSSPSTG